MPPIDAALVERAWQAYAKAHFQLDNSVPTALERKGMRAALEALMNERTMSMTNDTLIGRGLGLMRQFTDDLSRSFGGPPMAEKRRKRLNRNRISKLYKRGAGGWFEIMLVDEDGRDTGYIAKVTVTYDRFDADAANAR